MDAHTEGQLENSFHPYRISAKILDYFDLYGVQIDLDQGKLNELVPESCDQSEEELRFLTETALCVEENMELKGQINLFRGKFPTLSL
jgi:hypothetical protein